MNKIQRSLILNILDKLLNGNTSEVRRQFSKMEGMSVKQADQWIHVNAYKLAEKGYV